MVVQWGMVLRWLHVVEKMEKWWLPVMVERELPWLVREEASRRLQIIFFKILNLWLQSLYNRGRKEIYGFG